MYDTKTLKGSKQMKKFGFAVMSLLLASNVFFTNISYADNVPNTQSITNNKSTKIEEGYIRIHFENIKNGKVCDCPLCCK